LASCGNTINSGLCIRPTRRSSTVAYTPAKHLIAIAFTIHREEQLLAILGEK
jgi:hypothetical protein